MNRPFLIGKRRELAIASTALIGVVLTGVAIGAGRMTVSTPDRAYSCHVLADGGPDWSTMPPRPTYMWLPCEDTLLRDAWRDA